MVINMNIGGTEKALLNTIAEIPREKYDVTILMMEEYGGFLTSIPDHVHVEYLKEYATIKDIINIPPKKLILNYLKSGHFFRVLNTTILHLSTKIMKDRSILFKQLLKDVPKLKNHYDVAIAYAGPMDFISYFILNKIDSNKKLQWIHFDITKIGFNKKFASRTYKKFDKILVVSEEAREKLIKKIPEIEEKTDVLLNITSPREISLQSKKGIGFDDVFDGLRILTVGRLTTEKGQDLAINAMVKLIRKGHKVKWYCIGEGSSREKYEKLIEKNNLQENFILLGANSNPYPYIDQCDIYVQPSRYEGYCITLLEAKCLKKPIVTTDVNGAKEQIKHEENGLIVNINEIDIFEGVERLIKDKSMRTKFVNNLSNEMINSDSEMKKFFNVI